MAPMLLCSVVVVALVGCSAHRKDNKPAVSEPYVGLACQTGYPCTRLGVSVVVLERAQGVTAVVDGRPVTLRKGIGPDTPERPTGWSAFFELPEAQRLAESGRPVSVRIQVVALDGSTFETTKSVPVHKGYG